MYSVHTIPISFYHLKMLQIEIDTRDHFDVASINQI